MSPKVAAIPAILGLAGSKYAIGLLLIFYNNFNFWESVGLAVLGGMLGVLTFIFFSDALSKAWNYFFPKKKSTKIKINSRIRMIVWIRRKYGLAGIAFLTPLFLTVPVGTILANTFYKNKLHVFSYMFVAFTFWSVLLCGLYHWLNVDFNALIPIH